MLISSIFDNFFLSSSSKSIKFRLTCIFSHRDMVVFFVLQDNLYKYTNDTDMDTRLMILNEDNV